MKNEEENKQRGEGQEEGGWKEGGWEGRKRVEGKGG